MKDIKKFLNTPLKIGGKLIENRLILAPMTSLTHWPLRNTICSFYCPGLIYTEMCVAKAVPTENRYTSQVFRWKDEELKILVCQLAGNTPEDFVRAATRVEQEGFWGVDINMGCSVSRLVKRGYGAALLKDPDLAFKIVNSVCKNVSIPVIVKFRIGWEDNLSFLVDFAKRMEDAGASALIFHPRVALDVRRRPPKWSYISDVKKAVEIPVFGNGDVFSYEDLNKILETGCDGVALGRISAARPWIFASWLKDYYPSNKIYLDVAKKMLDYLHIAFDEIRAIKLYKVWAPYFFANFFYGHSYLKKVLKAKTRQDIEDVLKEIFSIPLKLNKIPNLNFLI